MTLRDLEDVFVTKGIWIIIGDIRGFDPAEEEDVLFSGELGDAKLSSYYDVKIGLIEFIDESTAMIVIDDNVIVKNKFNYYKPKVEKMLNEGYTVEQTISCIHGLYADYLINDATSQALYEIVDPEDKCDISPGEAYWRIDFDNPLL